MSGYFKLAQCACGLGISLLGYMGLRKCDLSHITLGTLAGMFAGGVVVVGGAMSAGFYIVDLRRENRELQEHVEELRNAARVHETDQTKKDDDENGVGVPNDGADDE